MLLTTAHAQETRRTADDFRRMVEFADTLAGQRKHVEACVKYRQVLRAASEFERPYQDAEFAMGRSLFALGFYQSAFAYFERIVEAGDTHPHYAAVLPQLLALHRKVPGDMSTLEKMARYDPALCPAADADEFFLNVGQYAFYESDLDRALEMLERVSDRDESLYLRARYLVGVVHVRREAAPPAFAAFQDILRFHRERGVAQSNERLVQLATLSVARMYFTISEFDNAVRYYDRISQFGDQWLDSLFEVSWAHFHLDNFPKALGNLHTLNSPYFEDEYFPESLVLQAVIFYERCRYADALEIIDRFIKEYWELRKELDTQLKAHSDPNEFYLFLARLSIKGGDFSLRLKRIFNAALSDKKLSRLFGLVVQLNEEIDGLNKLKDYAPARDMAEELVGDVLAYRELVIGEAGELARSRLQRVHQELKELLEQALKVKFEVLNKQKAQSEGQHAASVGEASEPEADVDREHFRWQFRGEYWRDELDAYLFHIPSQCGAETD